MGGDSETFFTIFVSMKALRIIRNIVLALLGLVLLLLVNKRSSEDEK